MNLGQVVIMKGAYSRYTRHKQMRGYQGEVGETNMVSPMGMRQEKTLSHIKQALPFPWWVTPPSLRSPQTLPVCRLTSAVVIFSQGLKSLDSIPQPRLLRSIMRVILNSRRKNVSSWKFLLFQVPLNEHGCVIPYACIPYLTYLSYRYASKVYFILLNFSCL